MGRFAQLVSALAMGLFLMSPAMAADGSLDLAGDHFAAGQDAGAATPVAGDAFLAGYAVSVNAPVTGNAHAVGYSVAVKAPVDADAYAAGYSVSFDAPVRGNVTAIGNTVTIGATGQIGRNARLYGATVNIDAPVLGAALIGAETLNLDGPVTGDLVFTGRTINFGTNARVSGRLTLETATAVTVPAAVASADRVSASLLPADTTRADLDVAPAPAQPASAIGGTLVWWVVLFALGAIVIALTPRLRPALEADISSGVWRPLGWGSAGFAMLIGMVPLLALTLVGLLLVPFALIFAAVVLLLSYIAGSYLVAYRFTRGWAMPDTTTRRLAVLALGIVLFGLIGLIPVLGWLAGLAVTAYGLGSFAIARLLPPPAPPVPLAAAA